MLGGWGHTQDICGGSMQKIVTAVGVWGVGLPLLLGWRRMVLLRVLRRRVLLVLGRGGAEAVWGAVALIFVVRSLVVVVIVAGLEAVGRGRGERGWACVLGAETDVGGREGHCMPGLGAVGGGVGWERHCGRGAGDGLWGIVEAEGGEGVCRILVRRGVVEIAERGAAVVSVRHGGR